jgi:hypothetical protein
LNLLHLYPANTWLLLFYYLLELVNEYEREDDEYLKRKVKNGTTTQKAAATKVLRGRGYFQQ